MQSATSEMGREEVSLTEKARSVFHLDLQLLFVPETEKRFALFNYILNQCIINTCLFNVEKAHIEERIPQRDKERRFGVWMP